MAIWLIIERLVKGIIINEKANPTLYDELSHNSSLFYRKLGQINY